MLYDDDANDDATNDDDDGFNFRIPKILVNRTTLSYSYYYYYSSSVIIITTLVARRAPYVTQGHMPSSGARIKPA